METCGQITRSVRDRREQPKMETGEEQGLTDKIATSYGKVSDSLLLRIQNGVLHSKFVAKDKRELFREWQDDEIYKQMSK